MKIRSDFVTNSSSSSFVIAYRESSNPLHNTLVRLIIDSNSHYDTNVAHVITNKEALDKKFLSWFGCSTDTILDVIRRNSDVRSEYMIAFFIFLTRDMKPMTLYIFPT